MKKITLSMLVMLLFLLSATSILAQTPRNSDTNSSVKSILEKVQSVGNSPLRFPNDLLSQDEQQILHNYYNDLGSSKSSFRAFGDVYVLDLFTGDYGNFPLAGPYTINTIGAINRAVFASDSGPRGDIYAIDNDTADLLTIEKDTGVATVVATLTGLPDGFTFTGLSWNPANLTMYVLVTNGTVTTLYTLDIASGILTAIGDTGTAVGIWIAIDNNGVIYMADIGTDSLYTLDATTSVATLIGPLGVDISFAQEADVDPVSNTLYMASFTPEGASEILSVDVTTGATTSLGAVTNSPELGIFVIDGEIDNNFNCADALPIGAGVIIPSNGPSNTAGGASNVCETGATNSEWYSYTATNTGDLTISSDLASNVGVDTRISVYNDDCAALACIGSDDNSGANNTSVVMVPVVSGVTYLIEWDDANNADPFEFELSLAIACPDPANFTTDAFTDTSADFSWDVVAGATNGYVLNVFNAGDDPVTDTLIYSENIPSGTLTATATLLLPETAYDAYLMADCDTNGMSNAVSLTFTTDIAPPVCGGTYVDTGGDAGEYSNDEFITTTITPDVVGDVVTVTFTYVDIETSTGTGNQDGCWDFLTVYDGPDDTFPVLAQTLCGEESGDGGEPSNPDSFLSVGMSFTSTDASGALTFVFTSDETVTETGWSADVTCGSPPACVTPGAFTNTLNTDSEATFTWSEISNAANGYVFSVFNASDDPSTETPVYIETIPFGTNTATATGLSSATTYDAYIIADCDADGISSSNSESFITEAADAICDGNFVDSGGVSGVYLEDESTSTTISPDVAGEAVTATFTYVDIEVNAFGAGSQDGCWDFLTVYDGPDDTFPILAQTLCGEESGNGGVPFDSGSLLSVGMSFTSTDPSGALTFVFTSDGSVQRTGWIADISCATLAVDEFTLESFTYYPNPTNGIVNISAKEKIDTIKVFNMLGQLVMNLSPNASKVTLDFSELNAGAYFLRSSINGNFTSHKIIKR